MIEYELRGGRSLAITDVKVAIRARMEASMALCSRAQSIADVSLQRLDSHIWSRTTSHVFIVRIATVLPTIKSALTTGLIRAEIRNGL